MTFGTLDLNITWFILIGVLFTGYAMLDGFDLGVGALHLFTKKDEHRRMMLNAIGPVWDGNEVWLVTGGGALFAAFPNVYATVFSGFYLAFVLLLVALIFRAVAIEFRSKQSMGWWRQMWDVGFAGGSILSSLLIGIAMGNIAWGVPIDERGELPAVPGSAAAVSAAGRRHHRGAVHDARRDLRRDEDRRRTARPTPRARIQNCMIFFIICYAVTTMATLLMCPHGRARAREPVALQRGAGQHAAPSPTSRAKSTTAATGGLSFPHVWP